MHQTANSITETLTAAAVLHDAAGDALATDADTAEGAGFGLVAAASGPEAAAPTFTASCEQATSTTSAGVAVKAAVVGGSGYTGALLAELLVRHPHAELAAMSSDTLAGTPVRAHAPRVRTELAFCRADEVGGAGVGGADVAFVCTPHGEAAPVVKRLLDDGVRVIDLSADFRLEAAAYAEWYGEHPFPELTPAVYGLTELHRDEVAGADLVANPGCYPTATLLGLTPLKALGLVDVVVDAKSGVSGAGKAPKASTHFCSVDSDLVAYGVGTHRHQPEIAAGLAGEAAAASAFGAGPAAAGPSLTFVPHLVPLQRGITATMYARLGTFPLPDAAELTALYREFYAGEPFVEVCDAPPQLKDVTGTNGCRIHVTVDERSGRVIVISAIDNLMKGASGQAVQNMNVMLGLPETEGLL
jgi:N-acetyl-gamma-glutamyl-phosphate reductase